MKPTRGRQSTVSEAVSVPLYPSQIRHGVCGIESSPLQWEAYNYSLGCSFVAPNAWKM